MSNSTAEADCLVNQVYQALLKTGCVALQEVQITGNHGLIILNGSVTTYYLKQLAQHAAMEVHGVRQLDNQLDVHRRRSSGGNVRREVNGQSRSYGRKREGR